MTALSEEKLKGLDQLTKENSDGLEFIRQISLNEMQIGIFYDEVDSRFVIDVYEIDQVTARYIDLSAIRVIEKLAEIVQEAW